LEKVVGGQVDGEAPHGIPMLSFDNAIDGTEVQSFFDRVASKMGMLPDQIGWVIEPKFDGMALSVRYHDDMVANIVTRGNGLAGALVTRIARHVGGVPAVLSDEMCVMPHENFVEANWMRLGHGEHPVGQPSQRLRDHPQEVPTAG
jgi:DNA ligase (NAD+)